MNINRTPTINWLAVETNVHFTLTLGSLTISSIIGVEWDLASYMKIDVREKTGLTGRELSFLNATWPSEIVPFFASSLNNR